MFLLKFVDFEWGFVGFFSWFFVYGIFMNRMNQLISGDNKGVVVWFMEDWFQRRKLNVIYEDVGWVDFVQYCGVVICCFSIYGMYV